MGEESVTNPTRQITKGRSVLGLALQLVSAVSLLISAAGLIILPILYFRGAEAAELALETLSREVQEAAEFTLSLGQDLDRSHQVIQSTVDVFVEIDSTLQASQPLVEDTALLLNETAPDLIAETSAALTAAEEGARAVDQVLRSLARIRFITGVFYDPDQSLDAGIAAAGKGLEPLPEALREVGTALENSGSGLGELRSALGNFSIELDTFSDRIIKQQDRLNDLAVQLGEISGQLEKIGGQAHRAAIIFSILTDLVLAGKMVILLALFQLGRDMRDPAEDHVGED